jgi:hypothetical protein
MRQGSYFKSLATKRAETARKAFEPEKAPGNITILIPRGEVIRNFVYTGMIDFLAEKANLSLVSVRPNSAVIENLALKYGEVHPLKEIPERWAVGFQRELIEMAHGRWLWSRAARERWRIRDAEAVSLKQKAFRAGKKALSLAFSNRPGLRILSKIERDASRVLKTTDEYINLYQRLSPSLVFNGSHVHSRNAIQAVQAANWLGIPTATFIFSWDNLTSQGRILLPYDYFLVWSEDLKRQLLEIYDQIHPAQVFVTGTPQFDFHFQDKFYRSREEFCREIGADPARPIALYTTGMANHMPGEEEIVEEIADMLTAIGGANPPQLLVRIYAKDLTGRFEELKKRRKDIIFPEVAWEKEWLTPRYEDSAALVNTLRHAAFGINVASTVSLELCMFDKPVINVGYNPRSISESRLKYADYYEFDHYAPVVESGAVEIARDRAEMRRLMIQALDRPARGSENRKNLLKKMFGETLDGNSARRVAEVLLSVAGSNE